MKSLRVKKIGKRLASDGENVYDIFCNGGNSSYNFHYAEIGKEIDVMITSIVDDRFFSNYLLLYIE